MTPRPPPRILTFYSYKGGTGRSMALANVAWILASNGKRVLAVDWDLEAPGLHRYFRPFLLDPELTSSRGVIDFVTAFVNAAVGPPDGEVEEDWYQAYTDLREFAVALRWEFPSPGRLDFVPAGRQGPAYAARVNAFDWRHFYDCLGGGVFLEAARDRACEHYDYVLIDSRTGVSDTSGICTIQMPDTLVVCFTANRQSIEGAAAVAASVRESWAVLDEEGPPRRIFPVLMRVELGEKERLERGRLSARAAFDAFLDQLDGSGRDEYWDRVETLYYPFYAYEEVLCVFGDRPGESKSLLAATEQLTAYLTAGAVTALVPPLEVEREQVLDTVIRGRPVPAQHQPPRPRQLPAPPADFVGRRGALEAMEPKYGESTLLSGIWGQGGVGKTALVLKLAKRLAPRYPDGQVYLDLRGFDPQGPPLPRRDVMAHVVRAFRPEEQLPAADAALESLYHSVLAEKHALLVLDNAAGPEQLTNLVPSRGCALLVTSRRRFTLPGLTAHDLEGMSSTEGVALLRALAPRLSAEKAGEVARCCGGLPLALRLAGSLLAERDDLSVERYLEQLRAEPLAERTGLSAVAASVRLSEASLPEGLRSVWRMLSVLAGSFEEPWAAAVWGVDANEAQDRLAALRQVNLLGWDLENRLYRLNALVHAYANALLQGAERLDAEQRHGRLFLTQIEAADSLYQQGGKAVAVAMRRFDRLWPDVRAAFDRAQHSKGGPESQRLCVDLALGAVDLLHLRQHPHERIDWFLAAVTAARALGDRRSEGAALGNLGLAYVASGQAQQAIECHEQHLAIARELADSPSEAEALGNLGNAYAELGQTHRAIACYEPYFAITREVGDRVDHGLVASARGEHSFALARVGGERREEGQAPGNFGQRQRSLSCCEQYLAIARQVGDRLGEGTALDNLGKAYADLGQTHRAIACYERYLAITREVGDALGEGRALVNLGQTHLAIACFEKHLDIARKVGDRRGEAIACWNLGLALEKLGRLSHAISFLEVCVAIEREVGHPDADAHAARVEKLRRRFRE